jgi:hypothetical protein
MKRFLKLEIFQTVSRLAASILQTGFNVDYFFASELLFPIGI